MNKLFKILWNACRQQHVVCNEKKHSHTKGRGILVSSVVATLSLGSGYGAGAAEADLIPHADWNKIKIEASTQNGHQHYKVTTEHINGKVAANRFQKFDLQTQNLADLHLPNGTDHLVNFVDQKIKVNGTVNAIKDSKVGGNLYFVSQQGMTVGKTGVINAGSLTAIAPTKKAYEHLSELTAGGGLANLDEESVQKLQKGHVALDPNAVITVEGNINAGNQINLIASQIKVGEKARISNKVTNIAGLVNVTSEDGNLLVKSEVQDSILAVDAADGSGDILLLARNDTSDSSSFDSQVKTYKSEAKIEVAKEAKIESRGNLKAKAIAGFGEYNLEEAAKGKDSFNADPKLLSSKQVEISAKVNINGTLQADGDVSVESKADATFDGSSKLYTVEKVAVGMLQTTPFTLSDVDYAAITTSAETTIDENSSIVAKGDLRVLAEAKTDFQNGAGTGLVELMHNTYEQKIPSIAASVAILNSSAKVTVKGDLTSEKDLEVSAKNNFKVNATASSKTYNAEGIPLAVFVGKFNSGADVIVENTANLKSKGALSVSSHQNSSVKTDAEITIGEKSYGGIAFNYTELNTHADTSFHGVLNTSTPPSSITIEADNRTSDLTVRSVNMSNLPGVTEAMQNLSGFSTAFLDGLFGGSSSILGTTLKEGSFKNGGVATVVTGTQTASVKVGGTLEAKGDIKIASSSVLYDHFFEARNAVETKAEDDGQEKKEQGAISILVQTPGIDAKGDTVESSLVIEDNASIHSSEGQIIISSQAQIEWNRVNKMKEDLQEVINAIKKYANEGFSDQWDLVEKANADLRKAFDEVGRSDLSFTEKMLKIAEGLKNTGEVVANFILEAKVLGELLKTSTVDVVMGALEFIKPTNYFNAYVASSTAGKEKVGLSGSILFKQQSTSSTTLIGKNTHIWTSSTSDKKGMENVGNIIIRSDGLNESLTLGGHLGTVFGIPLPGITKSHTAVGGSLNLNMLKSNNQTMIQEGALIEAANTLGVNSADRVYGLNIGASSDVNKGKTVVDLLLAMTMAEGKNALSVDDESHLSGKELTVVASRDDDLQTIAGAIVVGAGEDASNVAGAGFAFNDANLENTWKIEDNDSFGIVDGMLVDNKLPSIVDNNPGQLKSSGTVLLLASHDVAMNAIGVAGSIAYTAEDDGSKNFLVRAAETISGIKDSITNFAGIYKSEYHAHFNELGKNLNKRFTKTQTENDSAGSAMSDGNNASLAQGGDTATTNPEAGGEGSGSEDSRTESFQISLAGSFGMNFSEVNNQLIIDAKDFSIQSSDISIDAVTDKWIGAWAGAAGISYVSGDTNTSTATSIGGAVAVNSATFNNRLKVSGLRILRDPDGDFQTLRIRSTSNGNLVAEGLPLALSMGDAEKNNAFDAGVSANLVKTSVENSVSDLTREEETQKLAYEQTAWAGDNQITGGTGFSFAGQGTGEGTSYAGSLIVAVAQIENTITTKLENSTLKGVDSAQVKALANLNQVTTAISGSISSNSKSFNFSGAAAAAELKNTVDASINGVTFEGPGSQSVLLASRVGGAEEEKDLEDLSKKKWYAEKLDQLSNTAYFHDIGIYTKVKTTEDPDTETESAEPEEESKKKIGEIKNLDAFGSMKQTTVVLSPTFGDKGVGAAVVVNEVLNTFGTKAENSSILLTDQNSKFLNEAVNDVFTLGLAVGVAGGKGVFNAAGSVVVSNIDQTARVFANNLNINAHQTDFLSKNEAIAVDVAGNVAVTVGESSKFAGGASVTVMNTNNYASLEASDISVQGFGNEADATLKAENQAQSWGVAVDAAVSTKVGIGGAVAVNRVLNRSFVSAKDITSSGLHSLKFNTFDNGEVWTLAGNVAVGTQGGGASGAVGYSSLGKKEDQGSGVSVQGLELVFRS